MRIVIDYRPALRARTGIGEYIHEVIRELAHAGRHDEVTLFSSSWTDRPSQDLAADLPGVRIVDRRIPVRALNLAWHRLGWPPVEAIAGGPYDVAHSPHPLLMPSRSAAQLVTIHDLDFMRNPARTSGDIRRDYPALAGTHARLADRIIVSSRYAAGEVERLLQVPGDRIAVCPAGAPRWSAPALAGPARDGYILFLGTLDARKNIGGLLEAYSRLVSRVSSIPRLVLAGGTTPDSTEWLEKITVPPLGGHVEYLGYISAERREAVYKGARLLVLPSFEEGFGLPVLEAMAAGVPVVASNRGALPEVLGDAGTLIDPEDVESLAAGILQTITETALNDRLARRGLERAREFTWERTARLVRQAYEDAVSARRERSARVAHAHRH